MQLNIKDFGIGWQQFDGGVNRCGQFWIALAGSMASLILCVAHNGLNCDEFLTELIKDWPVVLIAAIESKAGREGFTCCCKHSHSRDCTSKQTRTNSNSDRQTRTNSDSDQAKLSFCLFIFCLLVFLSFYIFNCSVFLSGHYSD